MQLEQFHHERFTRLLQSEFLVMDEPVSAFPITLVDVGNHAITPHQESFSVIFLGPVNNFIPQGIHKLNHQEMGEIDIFLVPIALDKAGFRYEAVFNRLIL